MRSFFKFSTNSDRPIYGLGLQSLVASFILFYLMGCSVSTTQSGDSVVKDCSFKSDQMGTFAGKWSSTPIPLAFQQGAWSDSEMTQLMAAADSWNTFFQQSQGIPKLLDYGSTTQPNLQAASHTAGMNPCGQAILQNGAAQYIGRVVLYKQGQWNYPGQDEVMALTFTCPIPSTPIPNFYMALTEFNFQHFWVQGNRQPDLQTIAVHELGHLLGLHHSCDSPGVQARTGVPRCDDPTIDNNYLNAVMFPTFSWDHSGQVGEQRRILALNDKQRAVCLYRGSAQPTPTSSP